MAQLRIAISLVLWNFDVHFPRNENPALARPDWATEHIFIAASGSGEEDETEELIKAFSPGFKKMGAGTGTLWMNEGVQAIVSRRKQ